MRGKVVKRLRRAAEAQSVGAPYVAYDIRPRVGFTLKPSCTRAIYQRMKRNLKLGKGHN